MIQLRELLSRLNQAGVEYVIIGGVAANLHGSTLVTTDLDICCPMTEQNMARLLQAIGDLHPIFRGDPRKIPLPTNTASLARFNTMILQTDLGSFDVLRQVDGVGEFQAVTRDAVMFDFDGLSARVIGLENLLAAKKAAGREKDMLGLMHLESAKKRIQRKSPSQ